MVVYGKESFDNLVIQIRHELRRTTALRGYGNAVVVFSTSQDGRLCSGQSLELSQG